MELTNTDDKVYEVIVTEALKEFSTNENGTSGTKDSSHSQLQYLVALLLLLL
jgi:hypothetical protein